MQRNDRCRVRRERDSSVADAADYTAERDMFGQMAASLAADGSLDLVVDTLNYGFWTANSWFVIQGAGACCEPGRPRPRFDPDAAAVPEPALFSLCLGAAGIVLLRPK